MLRLLKGLKPYWLLTTVVIILAALQTYATLYLPNLTADIIDKGVIKGDTNYILAVGGVMLAISIGGVIAAFFGSYASAHVSVGFGRDLRAKIFKHVSKFSLHAFDTVGTASMITRTTNDTNQVQQVMIMMLGMLITAPMMAIGGIIFALGEDVPLTLTLAVAVPILIGAVLFIMTRAIPLFQVMQKKLDRINLIVDENLTGVRVIRAFDRDAYEQARFDVANHEVTDVAIHVYRLMAILWPLMMLVVNLSSIAIVWFGSIRINNGDMPLGNLIAFLQYATQILFGFLMLSFLFIMLPRAEAAAGRINEVLAINPEITDPAQPVAANAMRGSVEFRDVTFSYPGAEEPALSHVSFRARPGQVTAIIGGTGAGKSTLVNLVPRFYDIESGNVLVDGVDVREQTQHALRAKVGFVPQKAVLFSGTIAENIRYGKPDADEELIRLAAATAQATEFIDEMPEGLESVIAQGGTNISGGQKQRLSIARALVRHPEIYIFDDTFSALDYATDARLRAALKHETADATVLIVAQRVSTVIDADQILVLDEGHLVGVGTHAELMENNEVYREIVLSQVTAEEIA